MPRTTTQTKPKKVAKSTNTNTGQEGQLIEAFPKNRKAIVVEVEDPEAIPGIEEKLDEDGMPITEDSEESETEEISLGDEDFGDRWEE